MRPTPPEGWQERGLAGHFRGCPMIYVYSTSHSVGKPEGRASDRKRFAKTIRERRLACSRFALDRKGCDDISGAAEIDAGSNGSAGIEPAKPRGGAARPVAHQLLEPQRRDPLAGAERVIPADGRYRARPRPGDRRRRRTAALVAPRPPHRCRSSPGRMRPQPRRYRPRPERGTADRRRRAILRPRRPEWTAARRLRCG